MEIDEANDLIIREALWRLGPKARLDPALLQEQIAKVVKDQGETIFAQLSDDARRQLFREGSKINEATLRRYRHIKPNVQTKAEHRNPHTLGIYCRNRPVFNFCTETRAATAAMFATYVTLV